MKMKSLVFSLFIAGSMLFSGIGVAQADDLKVSGFGSVTLTLQDDANDPSIANGTGCADLIGTLNATNCTELQTGLEAEVDFEKTTGGVTFRLDLDIHDDTDLVEIEQAKFSYGVFENAGLGLTFTGGRFNSPIGFEAQDAPDMLQTTNGQLFGLVPSNLTGFQLSGESGIASGSVIFANDWNNDPQGGAGSFAEENSIGFTLAVNPMPTANLSIGWLDSAATNAAPGPSTPAGNETLLDIVLSGTVAATPDIELLYALEIFSDDARDGMGLTLHATRGHHSLTVRYDTVETQRAKAGVGTNEVTGGTAAGDPETTSLTIALLCEMREGIATVLEYRTNDNDFTVTGRPDNDTLLLEFVATF